MSTVVLLSCTKSKLDHKAPAQELYSASPLFRGTLTYGKSLNPDKMYILSAEHHLVPLDRVLYPYDKTLKNMPADEKEKWGEIVIKQLQKEGIDLNKDKFIFLTGSEYMKPLLKYISEENISTPMEGLRLGERMRWLNAQIRKITEIFKRVKNLIYECLTKTK
jgi:hypothetical protein